MNEEMKELISGLLAKSCFADKDGCLYAEIYADYRDEFAESALQKITEAEDPQEAFNEHIYEMYQDAQWSLEDEIINNVSADLALQKLALASDMTDEDLREAIQEMFYVAVPFDHYLRQEMLIDILIDAGDLNTDYSSNSLRPHYAARGVEIPDEAGILWLIRQQGYNKSEFKCFAKNPKEEQSFLYSTYYELLNCSSSMNVLTFLVRMTLEEYFRLRNAIDIEKSKNKSYYPAERKGRGYIVLTQTTTCGLYDPFNGAGSTLEIKLEKDVRLPIRLIESAKQDGVRGYSVRDVFGVTSALWKNGAVKIIHPMKFKEAS